MALFLVTPPAFEPLTLTEAKLHARATATDTTEDPLFEGYIAAARLYCEDVTRRKFVTQTFDEKRDGFPCGPWSLQHPPVSSVTSISYIDTAGATQTWSSSLYLTSLPVGPHASRARITPAYGQSYPATYPVMDAVTVRFVCGYTGTAKTIASITRTSQTATATVTAGHGYSTGQRVTIAGAAQTEYNGTFEITSTGTTTFTFTVTGTPATATGTLTATDLGIPAPILAAMKLLIGHWYSNREAVNVGNIVSVVPKTVDDLLYPFRVF
jgi:uncharacterized phiE125 gp8 family phage protein